LVHEVQHALVVDHADTVSIHAGKQTIKRLLGEIDQFAQRVLELLDGNEPILVLVEYLEELIVRYLLEVEFLSELAHRQLQLLC
jgi:hypothetical protein